MYIRGTYIPVLDGWWLRVDDSRKWAWLRVVCDGLVTESTRHAELGNHRLTLFFKFKCFSAGLPLRPAEHRGRAVACKDEICSSFGTGATSNWQLHAITCRKPQ